MNSLVNTEITFYIRTAKKLGYIEKSKKTFLSCQQLKQMVAKKSKIPVENQVIFYNGQKVEEGNNIKIVDKAIIHVVDSRNVGKSKMKLQVKRLSQTSNNQSFEVDSNTSIEEFIQKQLSVFYQEPAEKLFFVYSGRQLKRQKSFLQQYVEQDTQIICVHQEKDKKPNKKGKLAKRKTQQQKQKDSIRPEVEQINKTQQKEEQKCEKQKQEKIVQNIISLKQQQIPKKLESTNKKEQNDKINQENNQTESRQTRQNDLQQKNDQKVNQKADLFDKFSEVSSISEANFKKKNKVKQILSINNKNYQSDSSPSLEFSPIIQPRLNETKQNFQNQETPNNPIQKTNAIFKTREQIFQSNIPTYASVIDEPQDSLSFQVQENNIKASTMSFYNQTHNDTKHRDRQIFDSGMNFEKQNNSKLEVKYNKGFMNMSNASFLSTSRPESAKQTQKSNQQDDKTNEFKLQNNKSQIYLNSPSLLDYSHSRTIQIQQYVQNNEENTKYQKQIKQENKLNQESEDNLFVQIHRGIPPSHNYQNDHYEISESNLLSDTYHHPNTTDMNSFTFNLSQNPDQTCINQRQSNVQIILEQSADEEEVQAQVLSSKRESEIETNCKESANPSQVQSHIYRNNVDFNGCEHNTTQTCSLIDNLISMDEQKISNQIDKYQNNQKNNKQKQDSQIFVQYQQYHADTESQVHQFKEQFDQFNQQNQKTNGQIYPKQTNYQYGVKSSNKPQNNTNQGQNCHIKIVEDDSLSNDLYHQQENHLLSPKDKNMLLISEADEFSGTFQEVSYSQNPMQSNLINDTPLHDPQEITFRKDQPLNQSNLFEPQGSKLLHQLSLLAQNQTQQPQLLPGDYIYSTDLVDTPEEVLQSILNKFSHCF